VLEKVIVNQPHLTQETYDEFLATSKRSEAAVQAGDKVDLFLKHSASPNELSDKGQHPLAEAIRHERPWLFNRLISHPHIKPEHSSEKVVSPLEMAILKGKKTALDQLLGKGVDVSLDTVFLAAECGDPEIYERVLKQYKLKDDPGEFVDGLEFTLLEAQLKLLLIGQGNLQGKLIDSIEDGFKNEIPLFFKAGMDINKPLRGGDTPLLFALDQKYSSDQAAITLLMLGADPNYTNNLSDSALTNAATYGKSEMVKRLLDYGAKVETTRENGWKTLHMPVHYGHHEVVQQLIDAGADIEHEDSEGWTPLHYAVYREWPKVVDVLLKAGAKNKENNKGRTPLDMAKSEGIEPILAAFRKHNIGTEPD